MKPGFALSLSFEGISLLQRAAGGWRRVGEVSLEAQDLTGELARLRDRAVALGSGEMRCKVIIPNDQIRFLSVETGSFTGEARMGLVRSALGGATPYPVDDLAFDISVDGATTQVAAVARETLAEAEAFAVEHGFHPLSFVSAPGDNPFLGEPFFGATEHAATLPGADEVEPDGIAVVVIGPVEEPVSTPDAESEPEPEPVPAGFSSRRRKPESQEEKTETPLDRPPEFPPESPPEAPQELPLVSAAPLLGGAERDAPPAPAKPAPVAFRSSALREDDAALPDAPPEQVIAPEPVSVTAPTLDIPEADETDEATGLGGFLSRRKKTERVGPAALAPAASNIPPAPPPVADPMAGPSPTMISSPVDQGVAAYANAATPADETERMTVFGAREHAKVGGKPQHLGLILSAILLLFLAAVAVWASIFLEDGVAGLFRASPAKTELAAVPGTPGIGVKADEPASPSASDPATQAQRPPDPVTETDPGPDTDNAGPVSDEPEAVALLPPATPGVSGLPPPRYINQPDQPASPGLTDTDSAVLDALSDPARDEDQAVEAPVVPAPSDPQTGTDADTVLAATGIRQNAPEEPDTPSIIGLDDLYVASIDRTDLSQDAVALPNVASLATDLPLGEVASPQAAGTAFDLDRSGLVVASVEGTLNPDGVMIYLGRPAVVPPAVPTRFETQPETDAGRERLAGLRPRLRPGNLEERFQRENLGGLTRAELGGLRPRARPESHQQETEEDAAPTAQAVVSSRIPPARPGNFAAIVSAAIRPAETDNSTGGSGTAGAQTAAVAPRTVTPNIPSSASVARQATMKNEINLRRVNLIGVYGTPSNRRALVRLPSGRYKKVKVGDTVDGGRVVAIGDSELRYQKSGRNMTLKIPSS